MSRTWKDQPYHVKLRKHASRGDRMVHDHTRLGVEPVERVATLPDRRLSIEIPKGDPAALREHRTLLSVHPDVDHWDEVEIRPFRYVPGGYDWGSSQSWDEASVLQPAQIKFEVYLRFTRHYASRCTPVEDYDYRTHRDRVTGEWASCTPEWPRELRYRWCTGGHEDAVGRGEVRSRLAQAAREFNYDEVDEYWDDPVVCAKFAELPYVCWC